MRNIEAVVFDAGGVLRQENGSKLRNHAVKLLGISKGTYKESYGIFYPLLSTGRITEEEFWHEIKKRTHAPFDIPDDFLLTEHIAQYSENKEVRHKIKELTSRGIQTALLSNSIASNAAWDKQQGLYDGLNPQILSHEVGIRKPDVGIYYETIEQLDIEPSRILFIDDRAAYVKPARKIGMSGLVYKNSRQLKTI